MNIIMISAFLIYFCTLTIIGLFFYDENATAADFMIGDRSTNYWVTAIATQASDMGSWLFLGLPAMIYLNGLSGAWIAIGLVTGMYLTWQFIAPQLRINTAKLDSLTLPSYFSHRFNDKSGAIQLISAFLSLLFFTFYIASGLVGLSLLFESALDVPYSVGITISLSITALYALIGGFVAIAWCDFFQGMFLVVMIMIVPIYAFFNLPNGLTDIYTAAQSVGKTLSPFESLNTIASSIMLAAGWGLGYFGQPHILINFMGIDDPKKINAAKRIGISWQILVLTSSVCIGLVGIGFFRNNLINEQLIFVNMTTALFSPFFAGLILCAIIAATLSTIDSLILAAGVTITQDIYEPLFNKNTSSPQPIWISRIGSIIISLISLGIAWNNNQSINNLVNYAWAGLGSSFGPLIIMSLYSKQVTRHGALAGMLVGGLTAAFWPYIAPLAPELPLVPGFFSSLFTIYLVSLLTK